MLLYCLKLFLVFRVMPYLHSRDLVSVPQVLVVSLEQFGVSSHISDGYLAAALFAVELSSR